MCAQITNIFHQCKMYFSITMILIQVANIWSGSFVNNILNYFLQVFFSQEVSWCKAKAHQIIRFPITLLNHNRDPLKHNWRFHKITFSQNEPNKAATQHIPPRILWIGLCKVCKLGNLLLEWSHGNMFVYVVSIPQCLCTAVMSLLNHLATVSWCWCAQLSILVKR